MKNSKKTQLLIVSVVGILLFSFLPTVQGYGRRRTNINIRPIEDWLDNNPYGAGAYYMTGYVGSDTNDHYYWTWFFAVTELFEGEAFEYSGYVKEKVLLDGAIEITVNLYVKDMAVELYDNNAPGDPIWTFDYMGQIVFQGRIDYYFQIKFTLDAEYDGYAPFDIEPGTREAGCALPSSEAIIDIPEQMGIHLESILLIATGEGNTLMPGWYWWMYDPEDPTTLPVPDGGTAKLFMFHYAHFGPDNPLVWPYGSSGFKFAIVNLY
ncbi:MAG: hypothetical protein EAX91_08595 [Candidatus Lokiarchaeota archaeon]|nr:hypothetical protein [Candidatus Lokiarchaeota archaeon]